MYKGVYTTPLKSCLLIIPERLVVLRWNFGSVNKTSLRSFSGQNHSPPEFWCMPKWIILKLGQTIQTNYLLFYNNLLVSQVRDILCFWNFLKKVFVTKEIIWWCHSRIWLTSAKILFWSVNYAPLTWPSQWRHQSPSFHNRYTRVNYSCIPYLESPSLCII